MMDLMSPCISVTAFSMSPFDSLSPFTASSVVTFCFAHFSYTISERNDCRFCVALQRDLTITKSMNFATLLIVHSCSASFSESGGLWARARSGPAGLAGPARPRVRV